ncbi:hypothetical protein KAU33_05325 [Candidatus Dependentiae bacterium]|nr:hypothetical protein [Candidatus Dependentiae bacterium]
MKKFILFTLLIFILSLTAISVDVPDYKYTEVYQFNSEFTLKKFTYEFPVEWDNEWYSHSSGFRISDGSLDKVLLLLNRELKLEGELVKDNFYFQLNYIEYKNQDFEMKYIRYQLTQKIWKMFHVLIFGVSEYDKTQSDFGVGIAFRKNSNNFIELKYLNEDFLYNMKADVNSNYERGEKPGKFIINLNSLSSEWLVTSYISISTLTILENTLSDTESEVIKDYCNYGFFQIHNMPPMLNWTFGVKLSFQEHIYSYRLFDRSIMIPYTFGDLEDFNFIRGYYSIEVFSQRKTPKATFQKKLFYGTSRFKWKEYTYPTNNNVYRRDDYGYSSSLNYKFTDWFSAYFNYYFMYTVMKQEFQKPDVEDFNYKKSGNTFAVGPTFTLKKGRISVIVNYDVDSNTFDGGNIQFQLIL